MRSAVDQTIDKSVTDALSLLEGALRTGQYVPSMPVRQALAAVNGAAARALQNADPLESA